MIIHKNEENNLLPKLIMERATFLKKQNLSVRVEKWKNKRSICLCVGLGLGCGWGLDASVSNRETHVENGTNQKDAWRKKGNQPDKTQSQ